MAETDDCECKVGRVVAEYDVGDVAGGLVDEWQTGTSVRRLTERLNQAVVEAALAAANADRSGWRATPVYEALHTDELSEVETIEIERELDRAGVDVAALSSDLVSHQTVYRHLTGCLGASKDDDRSPDERRSAARDTVNALRRRTEVVTESTLGSLARAGVVDLGDVNVVVDLAVVCDDCGRSMTFETAVDEGCRCSTP